MRKALVFGWFAIFVQVAITGVACAKGPYGNIHVGNWRGGAFTDDTTGTFSHCAATTTYGNGIILVVGQNAGNSWLLSFASPNFHLKQGETVPIDLTFDGSPKRGYLPAPILQSWRLQSCQRMWPALSRRRA